MTSEAQKHMGWSGIRDHLRTTVIAVALALPVAAAQAQQVYKWVDEQGRVQYSERKPTGANTATTELKPPPPPQPVPTPPPVLPKIDPNAAIAVPKTPARQGPPPALSEGMNRDTDAYRCALAKDILNGSVYRPFGGPIDDHDRRVAQGDLRLFCK